jgi:hypothetical protein
MGVCLRCLFVCFEDVVYLNPLCLICLPFLLLSHFSLYTFVELYGLIQDLSLNL